MKVNGAVYGLQDSLDTYRRKRKTGISIDSLFLSAYGLSSVFIYSCFNVLRNRIDHKIETPEEINDIKQYVGNCVQYRNRFFLF